MIIRRLIAITFLLFVFVGIAIAQDEQIEAMPEPVRITESYKPQYIPPSQLLEFLNVSKRGGNLSFRWNTGPEYHIVDIYHNESANLIVLSGSTDDVAYVKNLINLADIPPRQIEIEVMIIEIFTNKARDLGFDWDEMIHDNLRVRGTYASNEDDYIYIGSDNDRHTIRRSSAFNASIEFFDALKIIDEKGAGRIYSAPQILTLNNRRANILDGERVTYITRYGSYTNLYETDSLDAGLNLSVLPSLGESGYITLNIIAELTSLSSNISGSPVKSGQMLKNTIIVKDGESILLGGLNRTVDIESHKRFPILGHILPFIFSRKTTSQEEVQSYIILTPRVVDFNTDINDSTMKEIDGK